ncbi:hypothetical protein O6H91_08G102400 [Diphasiastrum complanatum]|uniref:Uncharacterized protein n=1 Tax=Diphasiastrum complanatum TaxID=34168 RepID=A0ACC2D0I5_DIPCM|nr:hypothetical protein O6H91_Y102900 [Diphasiastrum complanatum]KAJ7547752.1 hypothetical protein O6H91_08G102400 [Diphasiastrum complanatum]
MLLRKAYVTFLAGDGDYFKGAEGLAKSLRRVKSSHQLLVAVLPDVPESHRRLLRRQGCVIREIEPIMPPAGSDQCKFAMAHYVINYSKLRIWEFEDFSKLVYLDADIMVFQNMDELFDTPKGTFSAVLDCFCEKTWSHTPQYSIGYCQQSPDSAPWVKVLGPPPKPYFNAGMFVFEPSRKTFTELMQSLRSNPPTPFAEQDFLNSIFQKIFRPIPLKYNLILAMLWRHPENVHLPSVKAVHYCATGSKPWCFTGKEANMDREDVRELVRKWGEVYLDPSVDLNNVKPSNAVPELNGPTPFDIAESTVVVRVPPAA